MRNIILSFFILVIFSNVKAASVQNQGNNRQQSIGYASVAQPTVTFGRDEKSHTQYLDIIKNIVRDESENMIYSYECNNYHWVVTDFYININNSDRKLNKKFSNKKIEAFIKGSAYFIAYIKDNIQYFLSKYIHKYNFEKNVYDNLKELVKDLKKLIYDEFDQDLKKDLIKYESERKNEKYHKMAKEILEVLVHNSSMRIKGYFIKIRKDGNYMDLNQEHNLYCNLNINKNNTHYDFYFKSLTPEVAELITNLTREE
ncbi:fam-d protein [Plasmodium vinckei vinckei]|uniref:Fam-d protein n=1 Tax=Plasmodium vinckei vinckei TaxID=54757 RepID=A0A449BSN9_PLAVN|nr:fam-d protein [Plasmodium vinckei vinckei]VEV56464.1 fam-d protein [Plasmodium vinckei vinckei]